MYRFFGWIIGYFIIGGWLFNQYPFVHIGTTIGLIGSLIMIVFDAKSVGDGK